MVDYVVFNQFFISFQVFLESSSLPVLSNLFYNTVGQRVNVMILPVEFHKIHLWTHQVPSPTTQHIFFTLKLQPKQNKRTKQYSVKSITRMSYIYILCMSTCVTEHVDSDNDKNSSQKLCKGITNTLT